MANLEELAAFLAQRLRGQRGVMGEIARSAEGSGGAEEALNAILRQSRQMPEVRQAIVSPPPQARPQQPAEVQNFVQGGPQGAMPQQMSASRQIANAILRHPFAAAGLGGLGAAGAYGVAAGQDEGDLDLAQKERELQEVQANLHRFENLNRNDPNAVGEAQQFLISQGFYRTNPLTGAPVVVDRRPGPGLDQAIRDYAASQTQRFDQLQREIADRRRQQAFRRNQPNPAMDVAREIGPNLVGIGGAALGAFMRKGSVAADARAAEEAALAADRMLRGAGTEIRTGAAAVRDGMTPIDRVSRLNRFWTDGGAGENTPFLTSGGRANSFKRNPNAAHPATLYQPTAASGMRSRDYSMAALSGADIAGTSAALIPAEHERDAAQRDVDSLTPNSSPADVERAYARLEAAKNAVALLQAAQRGGGGLAFGRLASMGEYPYRHSIRNGAPYDPIRPDTGLAEREQMLLNQYLRR